MANNHGQEDDVDEDYYALLGLERTASKDEINSAFRRLSRIYHPDKNSGDEANRLAANSFFTKIKKAHEVLIDDQKRIVYDNLGKRGVEADGLHIIPYSNPQEFRESYEKYLKEREEQQLLKQTNLRGTVSVGINMSDFFDALNEDENILEIQIPECETNQIAINQSMDIPLSRKDVSTVSCNVTVQNGRGIGQISYAVRRFISEKTWIEGQAGVGHGLLVILKGFRKIGDKSFLTANLFYHFSTNRPGIEVVYGRNLSQQLRAIFTARCGLANNINFTLAYEWNTLQLESGLQLGIKSSFLMASCAKNMEYNNSRVKGAVKVGVKGLGMECTCETQMTKNSRIGVTMSFGVPAPVVLKLRVSRASQTFIFPILLYDEFLPSAIVYGTLTPIIAYSCIMKFIVTPYCERQKQEEILELKRKNYAKLLEKKKEADAVKNLLKESFSKFVEQETRTNGLIIERAFYGKENLVQVTIATNQLPGTGEVIDVTLPLQCLVHDSQISQPASSKVNIPGFYDPCLGEDKVLFIQYRLRNQVHQVTLLDKDAIHINRPS